VADRVEGPRVPMRPNRIERPPVRSGTRVVVAAFLLLLAAISYVLLIAHFEFAETPEEREFGVQAQGEPTVWIYFEPGAVDALNNSMQIRISIGPHGVSAGPVSEPGRDLLLIVTHDNWVERIELKAGQPSAVATFAIDLSGGNVKDYPFDSYTAGLVVTCVDAVMFRAGDSMPVPARVTVWEGLLGYHFTTTERAGGQPGEVRLQFQLRRSDAFVFFALAAYCAMLVLACSALAIGVLVFAHIRRPEITQLTGLAAIVLALPFLRNAVPAAPPLGIRADLFVFLWAELATVIALGLVVAMWARRGTLADVTTPSTRRSPPSPLAAPRGEENDRRWG
jgi:Domain of unknown function (DUF4436)